MPCMLVSSLYDSATCSGVRSPARAKRGAASSTQAMNPFMSAAPRAYRRPSRSVSTNGSELQACPATGTTSEWPDSISPGRSSGPIVANRLALPGSSPPCTSTRAPQSRSRPAAQSISAAFGFALTVSKATSRRRVSMTGRWHSSSRGRQAARSHLTFGGASSIEQFSE